MQDLAKNYVEQRCVSTAYAKNLLRAARRMESAGITPKNISPELVNRFIANADGLSMTSRRNLAREVGTIWRWGIETGQIQVAIGGLIKPRAAVRPAEAWSLQELRELLAAARTDNTSCGGANPRAICDYLPGWILIGYDTGMRHGDILRLDDGHIKRNCLRMIASKTGKPLVRQLSDDAVAESRKLIDSSPDGTLFQWFLTRRRSFTTFRDFLDRHGFAGSSKWLRRSCATYIARHSADEASRYLQHSDYKLLKHYVDETLLDLPQGPPPIGDAY